MADKNVDDDPFGSLALEIEPIASCFRHLNLTAPFLSDLTAAAAAAAPPSPHPPMSPSDSQIFFASLPQTQPAPASATQGQNPSPATAEPEPASADLHLGLGLAPDAPVAARKKSGSSRKRAKGVHLRRSESEGESGPESEPEPAVIGPLGVRVLPASIRNTAREVKKEKEKVNQAEGLESRDRGKKALAFDLMKVAKLFSRKVDEAEEKRIAEMDILDVVAMKGIYIEPPRWHRPGGYDVKPKS